MLTLQMPSKTLADDSLYFFLIIKDFKMSSAAVVTGIFIVNYMWNVDVWIQLMTAEQPCHAE